MVAVRVGVGSMPQMDTHQSCAVHDRAEPGHQRLYRAQEVAQRSVDSYIFPYYSSAYLNNHTGVSYALLSGYTAVYLIGTAVCESVKTVIRVVTLLVQPILGVGDCLLGWAIRPIVDSIYPVNPINQQRHLILIPRIVEKILGDALFYPLQLIGFRETSECLQQTNEQIRTKVNTVLGRLNQANGVLLNPENDDDTRFSYRATTVASSQLNAFAVPGGGMVVFSQLVKEIEAAVRSQEIAEVTVRFPDGSFATVDVRHVTLDDVLAALLGHEMTHVASRHSMAAMFGNLAISMLLKVAKMFVVLGLSRDPGEDEQVDHPQADPIARRAVPEESIEMTLLKRLLDWMEDQAGNLAMYLRSRQNEYEADVTGTYFANQAGYNPLGALYLQELLERKEDPFSSVLHHYGEFLFTHPNGEHRKRAIFSALTEINSGCLSRAGEQLVRWTRVEDDQCIYDQNYSSPAVAYARQISRGLPADESTVTAV